MAENVIQNANFFYFAYLFKINISNMQLGLYYFW